MDIPALPEAQQLEKWLAEHQLSITLSVRHHLGEGFKENGHTVGEWLDSSIRPRKHLPQELRQMVRQLGERVWEQDPDRILKVTEDRRGSAPPYLVIEYQRR